MLEAGESKIKVPADLAPGEKPLPGLQMAFLLDSHMAESRGRKPALSWLFLIRALILFMKRETSLMTSQYHHIGGLGFQHMNGRRTQTHIPATALRPEVEILSLPSSETISLDAASFAGFSGYLLGLRKGMD